MKNTDKQKYFSQLVLDWNMLSRMGITKYISYFHSAQDQTEDLFMQGKSSLVEYTLRPWVLYIYIA